MNEKIERLIQMNPAYEGTPLAAWGRETEHPFLCQLSDLHREFPNKFVIATDYLFSASSYTHQEVLRKLTINDVRRKSVNRRGSMQGGFPWTDENNPWPCFDDGKPVRPSLQINLKDVGQALGLALPDVLYQYWGEDAGGVRIIHLSDIEDKDPSWSYPDFTSTPEHKWPDDGGWIFKPDAKSGQIEWVGNAISVGEKAFELPDMAMFFEDEDPDEPAPWRDLSEWLQANGLLYAQAEFISKRLNTLENGFLSKRDACYEEFKRSLPKSRKGPSGRFLDKDCYLPGDEKYHHLVLQGMSCLYNPGALEERNPLQFEDAAVILVVKLMDLPLPPEYSFGEIEVGNLYSKWHQSGRVHFPSV